VEVTNEGRGFRDPVPGRGLVNMRERAAGESRISGKKAVSLVLTLTGTILLYRWMKRRS